MPTRISPVLRAAFWLGPTLGLLGIALAADGQPIGSLSPVAIQVAGIAAWMAVWWISEVVPVAATSLIPMAAFPLLGVLPMKAAAEPYMSPFIVLLMTGFMAALAIERWNLHRRLALNVLLRVGTSPARLLLGMMIATALCSAWISNTASTLIMLPIGLALLNRGEETLGPDDPQLRRFGLVLFLGIAYAASIGGLATPIGSPPNLIFLENYNTIRGAEAIGFADWMAFGVPTVVVLVPLVWLYLAYGVGKLPRALPLGSHELLTSERRRLGSMTRDELMVAVVFGVMALLWVTRKIDLGEGHIVGWAPALGLTKLVDDATVAVAGVLVLFALPSQTEPGERLLDWATAKNIPWDVVLLFGGGIALAAGFKSSGLSGAIASGLAGLGEWPLPLVILSISLVVTFLTEVTSNTATANILMPVLAAFATTSDLSATKVMIPAAIACSCAFMLPVATAPNALVYGTGKVPIPAMARTGFAINIGAALLVSVYAWLAL